VCAFLDECEKRGVLAGLSIKNEVPSLGNVFTVSTTEMHIEADYEKLIKVMKKARTVVQ
jgi:hypothetical protein